jgi:hypothetical protein
MVRLDNELEEPNRKLFPEHLPSILFGAVVGAADSLCGWQLVQLWNTIWSPILPN